MDGTDGMGGSAEIRISRPVDGPTQLHVDGVAIEVPPGSLPVEVGITVVAQAAARHGATVAALLIDEREGLEWELLISPSGEVSEPEPAPDDAPPPPRRRRRWMLLVAAAVVVVALGGFAFAYGAAVSPAQPTVGQPAALPTALGPPAPDDTAGPRSAVQLDPGTPPTSTMTAAPPPAQPTTRPQRTTTPKPAQPEQPAAEPTSLRQRAERQPVRPPPTAAPAPRPRPATTSAAVAAGDLVMVLQDGAGLCLTATGTFAACTGAPGQVWTLAGGALRNGDRCMVAVAGDAGQL